MVAAALPAVFELLIAPPTPCLVERLSEKVIRD